MGRFLTKQERKLLEKELRLERYARFSDRIKGILLLDAGKSPESIAEYLFLSRNTVANYLKRYQADGVEDLASDDYQGSECRLSEVQQQKFAQHLEETLYQTVSSIREHIQATYRVTYSLSGLCGISCADLISCTRNLRRYRATPIWLDKEGPEQRD